MFFGSVAGDHPHDNIVLFCEGYILVREVVVGMGKRCGNYLLGPTSEHEAEESLGGFIKVSGEGQTIIFRGIGWAKAYRM